MKYELGKMLLALILIVLFPILIVMVSAILEPCSF